MGAPEVLQTATEFARVGYCVVGGLLPEPVRDFLHEQRAKPHKPDDSMQATRNCRTRHRAMRIRSWNRSSRSCSHT